MTIPSPQQSEMRAPARRMAGSSGTQTEIDGASLPIARLVASPGAAGNHAMAWACHSGTAAPPLKTRILTRLENLAGSVIPIDEVWLFLAVPGQGRQSQICNLLSPDEQERSERFRFARDRWSYTAAHSLLRTVLAGIAGMGGDRLEFSAEGSGKPYLNQDCPAAPMLRDVHFNLSHTRGMVAVALARKPVGVDVEQARPVAEMRELVVELMSARALDRFDASRGQSARTALFMRYWTLSEAYLKASGEGLVGSTRELDFNAHGLPRLLGCSNGEIAGWQFGHAFGAEVNWNPATNPVERNL